MKTINLSAEIPDDTVNDEIKAAVQNLIQEKYKGAVVGINVTGPKAKGAGLKLGDL